MFDIGYFKGLPTEYIIQYVSGRPRKEGAGLAFYYIRHKTQIVAVPINSVDASFVFNEVTANFQSVTLQGQITYRIVNASQAASLLNFTIDPRRRAYLSHDPERLPQRIVNVVQMETRSEIQTRSMEESLRDSQAIAAAVHRRVTEGALLAGMGVELLRVDFLSARPTPEVGKALEAEYRESLLLRADEAIYARRAAAVEEERKIKSNELNTDIQLEQQRQQLIALQGSNAQQEAEFRGRAQEMEAEYRSRAIRMEMDAYRQMEPRLLLALAMKELGENAGQVGHLTITSEILAALLDARAEPNGEG